MKWRIFGSISCLCLGVASLWACGSSSTSSSESTGGGLTGACQRVANATSAFAQRCGEAFTAAGAADYNTHQIARSTALCVAKYSLPGIPDPTTQLNTCAQDLEIAACNTTGDVPSCSITTPGTLSNGTSCSENEQCSGGICSFSQSDAGSAADASSVTCGTCATATTPGQPCTDPTLCASGDCQGNSATDIVCVAVPTYSGAIGANCDDQNACTPPGVCSSNSTGEASGTCVAEAKIGESCDANSPSPGVCEFPGTCYNSVCVAPAGYAEDCSTRECALGLFCGTDEKCFSITYGPPGAPCNGNTLQCIQGNCPGGGFGSTTSTCPAIIADGQSCSAAVVPSCDTFSACTNGVCALTAGGPSCQ